MHILYTCMPPNVTHLYHLLYDLYVIGRRLDEHGAEGSSLCSWEHNDVPNGFGGSQCSDKPIQQDKAGG